MKPIKSVTFEALDNIANEIFLNNKSTNFETIRVKIANYLVTDGNKKFVEIYNELATTKNFNKAIQTFKI
jgi:hypothetical protein